MMLSTDSATAECVAPRSWCRELASALPSAPDGDKTK